MAFTDINIADRLVRKTFPEQAEVRVIGFSKVGVDIIAATGHNVSGQGGEMPNIVLPVQEFRSVHASQFSN